MRHRPQPGQERLSSPLIFSISFERFSLLRNAPRSIQPITRLWPVVAALDRNPPNRIAPSKFCIYNRAVTCDIVLAHAERDFIDIIDGRQSARKKFAKDHALGQS